MPVVYRRGEYISMIAGKINYKATMIFLFVGATVVTLLWLSSIQLNLRSSLRNFFSQPAAASVFFPKTDRELHDNVIIETEVEMSAPMHVGLAINLHPITNESYAALLEGNPYHQLSISKQNFNLRHGEPGYRQILTAASSVSLGPITNGRYHLALTKGEAGEITFSVTAPNGNTQEISTVDNSLAGGWFGLVAAQEPLSVNPTTARFYHLLARSYAEPEPTYEIGAEEQVASSKRSAIVENWPFSRLVRLKGVDQKLTNYQLKLQLNEHNFSLTQTQPDGRDIRFTAGNEKAFLSHWIEQYDPANRVATIWVKIPVIPAGAETTLRLYYGNPNASNISSGEDTFLFFDQFEHPKRQNITADFFAADGGRTAIHEFIHPAAQEYEHNTFISYAGPDFDPFITYYDHQRQEWGPTVKAGDTGLAFDDHGTPAMLIDQDGYIHVFFGSHDTPLKYSRSRFSLNDREPEVVLKSFQQQPDIGDNTTYPEVMQLKDRRILIFYRAGGHLSDWVYRESTDNGSTWSDERPVIDGQGPSNAFYAYFTPGYNSQTVHATFLWKDDNNSLRANPSLESYHRYNNYYMTMDKDGVWRNIKGEILPIPISKEKADAKAIVYSSVGQPLIKHTNHMQMTTDTKNRPYIVFTVCPEYGAPGFLCNFNLARWNGAAWVVQPIGNKDEQPKADNSFDGSAIWVADDGRLIEVYTVSFGSSGQGTTNDRGGNIERWITIDGGKTWTREIIANAVTSHQLFLNPQLVSNYSYRTARLVFSTYTNNYAAFNEKVYLWGDDGFITKSLSMPLYNALSTWGQGAVITWDHKPGFIEATAIQTAN